MLTKNAYKSKQFSKIFVCLYVYAANLRNGYTDVDDTFAGKQLLLHGITKANLEYKNNLFLTSNFYVRK